MSTARAEIYAVSAMDNSLGTSRAKLMMDSYSWLKNETRARPRAHERVLDLRTLADFVREWTGSGKCVGLCHGCFDVLHVGHLRHFEAARALCDILVVTVTPDIFVNKGPNRPVFPAEKRAELIAGLGSVDYVAINEWDSAVQLIELLKPSLFIKGQEYETDAIRVNPNFLAERQTIERVGGRVAFTYEWTSSSTAAIQRMRGSTET